MGKRKLDVTSVVDSAIIHPTASIGKRTKIWAYVQIAEHAVVGHGCVIGNGAYIDRYVKIGNRVRIHNKVLLYHGVIVEDDVFIGPGCCLTNDQFPRSGKTRNLKGKSWRIKKGASIGANATILPDVTIGKYALVGAGSVVTKNVSDHIVVCGNPASQIGFICSCGVIEKSVFADKFKCKSCGKLIVIKHSQKK